MKHTAMGDEETTRSGLFMEAVRIIKEMRSKTNGEYPKFALWENVPGALSSNAGDDFRVVIEELAKIVDPSVSVPRPPKGKWTGSGFMALDGGSLAWRIVDAQYHGVPQRRRRILLVLDLGGQRAGEVSFVCEGLPGYPSEGVEAGETAPRDAEGGAGADDSAVGFDGYNGCVTGGLISTLGVNCGISSGRNGIVLNDQGGSVMNVSYEVTGTLRAEMGGHPPIIVENHPHTSPTIGLSGETDTAPTLIARCASAVGTTQDNLIITEPRAFSIQGNMIGRADENGPQGDGVNEDKSFTLNTVDRHAVAYGISSYESNAMKSKNPHSGVYEADTSRTLDLNGGNPACNQGGIAVVEPIGFNRERQGAVCMENKMPTLQAAAGESGNNQPMTAYTLKIRQGCEGGGKGALIQTERSATLATAPDQTLFQPAQYQDKVGTLCATDYKWVQQQQVGEGKLIVEQAQAYGLDRASFNQGSNAKFGFSVLPEQQPTMTAKGPAAVCTRYIVRRLTPTECARLQGFPDFWGHLKKKEKMTNREAEFWQNVYVTHQVVVGGKKKEEVKLKSREQLLKWYNDLWTDSSEYKMWGNGVALPCVRVPIHNMAKCGCRTLASLFDGSGGFPLAGILEGIVPLWCSEIEPYPIAVTRERFGEE